jgi:hypothetical protein
LNASLVLWVIYTYPYGAALKRVMDKGGMELEIILNPKVTERGDAVIQVTQALEFGTFTERIYLSAGNRGRSCD